MSIGHPGLEILNGANAGLERARKRVEGDIKGELEPHYAIRERRRSLEEHFGLEMESWVEEKAEGGAVSLSTIEGYRKVVRRRSGSSVRYPTGLCG